MSKYIQNTHSVNIQIDLREDGRFLKSIIFQRYNTDRITGQVVSDGFTEVSDEDYARLSKSRAYGLVVKSGRLVEHDKAPLRAGSFEQILEAQQRIKELEELNAQLTEKLKAAEAKIARLEGGGDKGADDGDKGADDGLSALSYDDLKAKATELGIEFKANVRKDALIALIREKAGN